jgi:hypothetical protein
MDLPISAARHLVGLLDTLSQVPSTPQPVADSAIALVGRLGELLPDWHHPQQWHRDRVRQDVVTLDLPTTAEAAELLDLFAAMPSTPPTLAGEAEQQAEMLWRELGA